MPVYLEKRKHPNGTTTWLVRPVVRGRRLPALSFRLKDVAKATRDKMAVDMERANGGLPAQVSDCTLEEMAQRYLADAAAGKKARTVAQTDRPALKALVARFGAGTPAAMITSDMMAKFRNDLGRPYKRGKKTFTRKPGGVRRILDVVRAMCNWARKQQPPLLLTDPFLGVTLPASRFAGRLLPDGELRALMAHLPASTVVPTMMLLWTGMRRSEVAAMDWRQLFPADPQGRIWMAYLGTTKNGEPRNVPVHPRIMAALGEPKQAGRVFPDLKGEWLTHALMRAAKASGVTARLHDVRHTWATRMGPHVDWPTLKRWGGWKTDAAADRYQHEDPVHLAAVAKLMFDLPDLPGLPGPDDLSTRYPPGQVQARVVDVKKSLESKQEGR